MSTTTPSPTDPSTPLLPKPHTKPTPPNTSWAGELEPSDAPPKTGTIFSSAMNLAACALGASMLSLPYTMMLSGPIVAFQFLLLFAVMSFFSAQAVVNAGMRAKKSAYTSIVTHFFGPVQGTLADILLAAALIVAAISYIVGLADLLPAMIPITAALARTARICATVALLFPLTLVSSLAAFGPASAIAAAGCYVQAAALVLQLYTGPAEAWHVPATDTWTQVDLGGLVFSLPMICFVYAFHYVLTDTLAELRNPTRMRMACVNITSVALLLGCYIPVAISGYLVYSGENIPSNALTGLAAGSPTALIAKWSIGALLLITYSLFIIPLRRKFEFILFREITHAVLEPRRLLVAALLNVFVCYVAVSLPDLGLANTLAGGCIALIMFFFPGRLMVRAQLDLPFEERDSMRLAIGGMFVFFGALICFVGLFGGMIFDY